MRTASNPPIGDIGAGVILATLAAGLPPITASHAEFVDWARTTGQLNGRIVDFLASRSDCAGATRGSWARLSAALASDWFSALDEGSRHDMTDALIGSKALNAFVDWANGRS